MLVWMDTEDGTRGGSVYLKRKHYSAQAEGKRSEYIRVDTIDKRLSVILRSWLSDCEVRGTVPREIPTLMLCKRKRGYIQSPPSEWSRLSRVAMRVLLKSFGATAACVSNTTRIAAREVGIGIADVEYAKIGSRDSRGLTRLSRRMERNRRVTFVVMDSGLVDKGYLRHLSIIDAIASSHEINIEAYGPKKGVCYDIRGGTHSNGFRENPFEDSIEKNAEDYIFYLGCSRYEGLHMAVVEGGHYGIPSILSDIPAHRELELISGNKLLIGKMVLDNIQMVRQMLNEESYRHQMKVYEQLATRFSNVGKNGVDEEKERC